MLNGDAAARMHTAALFGRTFKKFSKSPGPSAKTQDLLDFSDHGESLSDSTNTKGSGGTLSGMFKKSSKADGSSAASQDEFSKSNKNLSNAKKEPEGTETHEENWKQPETNATPHKSNTIHEPERRKRSGALLVPPRLPEEELKHTPDKERQRSPQETRERSPREMKGKGSEPPAVPARAPEEETDRINGPRREINQQKQSEGDKEDDRTVTEDDKEKRPENKPAGSDDEGLKDDEDSSSREKKKEEEGKDKAVETKVKKAKRLNPFMPQLKARVVQKKPQDGAAGNSAENEVSSRSLFERLEDFRIDPSQPEASQDVEDLMEWWKRVESWEDTPQAMDMTEKEEAKAFAVTAEKVQKGIRVFNKLFSERAEILWQHVIDLNAIAESLDKFNKNTKIAQITGGSTSAIGGVATIAGLALAPVTMGTSLIVTAVGLGVATAGGLTSAGAGISNQVNNSMDRKKVEKIVEDYQEKITDLNKCLKFIKQGIENLRRFDLIKMKKHAYNQDFPALTSQFYEDGAMAGKAILINANEIMRVVQIANVAGSTAARAVQIASMATGVLTGLFVGMDIYFVAKDSKELKKGAKSEFAAKIREVATQLHEGLVELNTIRQELQPTEPEKNTNDKTKHLASVKKDKMDKDGSSDKDEIHCIKKNIKKDIESKEEVCHKPIAE